nr:ankyrin repeat domain-containing protein [Akkermansiaceae bacterium]
DPFKFIRSHPVSSTTIEDAEIEFLRKILTNQPDAVAALKIPCRLAKRNRTQSLAFLLDHGIEVDLRERDSLNYTPLMYAAEYGDVATVRFLLDRGANVNALDLRKVTPLFIAAWHGRPSVVSTLLDRGGDPAISSPEINDGDKRMDFGTALHGAVQQGHIEVVKTLVGRGADINAISPVKQHTPLIRALALQRSELAEELLNRGADPNLPVSGLVNPLRQTAVQGNLPLLRRFLEKGAKLDMQSNESRLFRGVPRTVGAALVAAAREGNLHVAKALVDAGCPVDQIAPIYRETSLHAAALHGNTLMCRWLLESGADIQWQLADHVGVQSGWMPLHSAAWSGSIEVVDLLMQKGASPMDPCSDAGLKRSSFQLASLGGSHALVKLMLDHAAAKRPELVGKMLAQTDANGDTALHLAVSREVRPNAELVRILIAAGADPEATNRLGRTPRQLAVDPEFGTQDAAVRSLIGK